MTNNEFDLSEGIMDIDVPMSPSTIRSMVPDMFLCQNLLDGIRYILGNNMYQRNNETLTEHQVEIFEIIEHLRERPQKMFMYLCRHFAKEFDIDLRIIAFDNEKFSIINKDDYGKETLAYLSYDKDNKIHGVLYTVNEKGTSETVFPTDNIDIRTDVCIYVAHLNDKKSTTSGCPQNGEQQAVNCVQESIENGLIDNIPVSVSQSDLDKRQFRIVLDQMLQHIFRIIDGLPLHPNAMHQTLQAFVSHVARFEYLSSQDAILALKDGNNCVSQLIHMAEQFVPIQQNIPVDLPQSEFPNQNLDTENETNSIASNSQRLLNNTLPSDVSTDVVDMNHSSFEKSINEQKKYNPPTLNKPLASTHHPRTLKEFAQTRSAPVRCINSAQRDPIGIGVPPDDGIILHIGIEVVDRNNQNHLSKVTVPHETKLTDEFLINNNDRRCLNFDKCSPNDRFDRDNQRIYSEISGEERQNLRKNIRIHMLNFYQRNELNRQIVENQHLKECKLAFAFYTFEKNEYKCVSPVFYSDTIRDCTKGTSTKKKTTNKKPKHSSNTPADVH